MFIRAHKKSAFREVIGQETNLPKELIEIPAGMWAVMVNVQTDLDEGLDGEYVLYSSNTRANVVGTDDYQWVVIKQSKKGSFLNQKVLFWSKHPFVVIENWDSPILGIWVHMASRVNENGMSKTLPELTLPAFHPSFAGTFIPDEKEGKWCRLTELADKLGLDTKEIVRLHQRHFEGYESGVHVAWAKDPNDLSQTKTCQSVWTHPDTDELLESDLTQAWVRKRFALTVAYFNLVGWHKAQAERNSPPPVVEEGLST